MLEGLSGQDVEAKIKELMRIKTVAHEKWGDLSLRMGGGKTTVKVESLSKARVVMRTRRAHGVSAVREPV